MILNKLIHTSFILILFSCKTNNSNERIQIKSDTISKHSNTLSKTDIQENAKDQYANIIRIFLVAETTFIDADYIQFLTGDAAIEAAKKRQDIDTFVTPSGKREFAVPNDYFILNESKKIRRLPVAKDCVFDLIHNPDRLHPVFENSLKSLQIIFNDSPFILTLNDKGSIVKIKEVFLP
ncbi:hypothetical protein WG954_05515 [Lacibacter sp. H375]|uniref:hypothetical protein n=1 Tax=Lacibacter sp. H375 TaxID=3133424 RepID=UPI0030C28A6E